MTYYFMNILWLFIYSSIVKYLDCFWFLVIRDKTAVNFSVQVFVWT